MREYLFILIAVVGFIVWAKLQYKFVDSNENTNVQLLFPIVVPLLASILAGILYVFYYFVISSQDQKILINKDNNIVLLILSSIGLAVSYFLYPLILKTGFLNASILSVGIFIALTFVAFYEEKKIDWYKVAGLVLALLGVILMKSGSKILKTLENSN